MNRRAGKLKRDAVKGLAQGESLTEAGITALRLADGDIRWSVNVMVAGRRIHRVIGKATDGADKAQCEEFIAKVRTDERAERLQLPTRRKTWLTFRQAAARYLERMEAGDGRNVKAKRQHLEQHLTPYFGDQRADTLTEFTVNAYKKKRLAAGAAAGTVNRELATLKHFLREAVRAKDLKALPCTFAMLAEPKGRTVILSNAEAEALMRAAVGDQQADLWLFVAFGLNTAMRHREILRADRDGFIFAAHVTAKSGVGHRDLMSKPFARAVRTAGLDPKHVTPHTMRHTAITRLVEAGIDLPTIQRISGHKTLSMVIRYTHVSGAHIDAAMTALDRTIPEPKAADQNAATTQVAPELHTPRRA